MSRKDRFFPLVPVAIASVVLLTAASPERAPVAAHLAERPSASTSPTPAVATDANAFVVTTDAAGLPWAAGTVVRADAATDPGDILLVRADKPGRVIDVRAWQGGSGRDVVRALAVDLDGNVWVAGSTDSPEFPLPSNAARKIPTGGDAFVVKLSADASRVLGAWRLEGAGATTANALALRHAGGVVIAGDSSDPGAPGTFVALLDGSAQLLSQRNVSTAAGDSVRAAVVGPDGAITVAGTASGAGFAARFSASADQLLWREDLAAFGLARATRIGHAGDGALLVAGSSTGAAAPNGLAVARLDPVSGIASQALPGDAASDPALGFVLGGRSSDRLSGSLILDVASSAGGTLWIAGESFSGLPDGALAVADPAPGRQVFLTAEPLVVNADLSLAMTESPDPVDAGAFVTYLITVSNAGPGSSPGNSSLTVTDSLPAGFIFQSASGIGWTCQVGGIPSVVTCTLSTALAIGSAPPLTIGGQPPAAVGSFTNTAKVSSTQVNDTNPANDTASVSANITPVADLLVSNIDVPDPVSINDKLTYLVTVTNAGPSASDVITLVIDLPADIPGGTVDVADWDCTQTFDPVTGDAIFTCTHAGLPPPNDPNGSNVAPPIFFDVISPPTVEIITATATVSSATKDNNLANNVGIATTDVRESDLAVSISDNPDPVSVSSPLVYTVTVTNKGPSTPFGLVTVIDTLPAGVTFNFAVGAGWKCTTGPNPIDNTLLDVTCTRPGFPVNTSSSFTINVTAPSTVGTITNTAQIPPPPDPEPFPPTTTFDPDLSNNSASESTTVVLADLSIGMTGAPTQVNAGQLVTYTIQVANAGPTTAHSVAVFDVLPAGSTFGSAFGAGWICSATGGNVTCGMPTLPVGPAPVLTVLAIAPSEGGGYFNVANVSSGTKDPDGTNNSAQVLTTVSSVADVSIIKKAAPTTVPSGGQLTYTITVSSLGPSSTGPITVSDVLPPGETFVVFPNSTPNPAGVGWDCTSRPTPTSVNCRLAAGINGAGTALPITMAVNAPVSGDPVTHLVSNTATVSAVAPDPNVNDNSSTVSTTVILADLSIKKTVSAPAVDEGSSFFYTLAVSNAGPTASGPVTVTDTLPDGVTLLSSDGGGSAWSCLVSGNIVTCTALSIDAGVTQHIQLNVKAPTAGGTITNSARVSTAGDPNAFNNSSTVPVTVIPKADLKLTKTANPVNVLVGGTITYTLSVTNLGPSSATNVVVSDVLPEGVGLVSATGLNWNCSGAGTVDCVYGGGLGVNDPQTITIVVTAPDVPGAILNVATVSSDVGDLVPGNNAAQASVLVTDQAASGPCSTPEQLLVALQVADISPPSSIELERFLETTIAMSRASSGATASRLELFNAQVRAAEAKGRMDPETADTLVACSNSVAVSSANSSAAKKAKKAQAPARGPAKKRTS